MASLPVVNEPEETEKPLTREEAWKLWDNMYGTLHDMYERAGGVEAVIRERYDEIEPEEPGD